jgi:hypothetical protein
MPRFVILRHDPGPLSDRSLHWDFMLETDAGLLTWALESEPTWNASVVARQLPIHRRDYLDYAGPIAGGRGSVTRWDGGEFEWQRQSEHELAISVRGAVVQGEVQLTRSASDPQRWAVLFPPESKPSER